METCTEVKQDMKGTYEVRIERVVSSLIPDKLNNKGREVVDRVSSRVIYNKVIKLLMVIKS